MRSHRKLTHGPSRSWRGSPAEDYAPRRTGTPRTVKRFPESDIAEQSDRWRIFDRMERGVDLAVLAAAEWESQRLINAEKTRDARTVLEQLRQVLQAPEVLAALEQARTHLRSRKSR